MLDPTNLLNGLPVGLRTPLIAAYTEISRNYSERRWEPSELNGGKFCEVVYSIIDGATSSTYPATPSKPPRLLDACRLIEKRTANPTLPGDHSLRVLIPRLLPYLYDIRNNRGVGHIGGDVNPNFSDATTVFSNANWVMAELVRIFHNVTLDEAQVAVDIMVERKHSIVWQVDGIKRVLAPDMTTSDQILTLLYSSNGWVSESDLRTWVEYKNPTDFRSKRLKPLHKDRFIEFDAVKQRVHLTTRGTKDVEDRILPKYV